MLNYLLDIERPEFDGMSIQEAVLGYFITFYAEYTSRDDPAGRSDETWPIQCSAKIRRNFPKRVENHGVFATYYAKVPALFKEEDSIVQILILQIRFFHVRICGRGLLILPPRNPGNFNLMNLETENVKIRG